MWHLRVLGFRTVTPHSPIQGVSPTPSTAISQLLPPSTVVFLTRQLPLTDFLYLPSNSDLESGIINGPAVDIRLHHTSCTPMASILRNLSIRATAPSRNSTLSFPNRNSNLILSRVSPSLSQTSFSLAQRSTMATDAPKKMEWLVVIPDFPGAHQKRLEVRP